MCVCVCWSLYVENLLNNELVRFTMQCVFQQFKRELEKCQMMLGLSEKARSMVGDLFFQYNFLNVFWYATVTVVDIMW